ncbi:ADP-ribosylation factor GTPase-activating protein 2 [Portunus trituberculatus]|uniref:ADP-ribosylation factor GTPase-activating protein 2 n=1 Tax=Portunus trituberculatus TaxID=210409 RepID=A0A5B7DXD1_PORTR|nr:ADP-ribosylation factor GTPase-activating protein 2 [Portunus trituberculatus]
MYINYETSLLSLELTCIHNCTTSDAQQKYNSRAAQLYREKLSQMAQQAMRIHGTRMNLDAAQTQSLAGPVGLSSQGFLAASHPKLMGVNIDVAQPEPQEEKKEVDFFEDHASHAAPPSPDVLAAPPTLATLKVHSHFTPNSNLNNGTEEPVGAPNVEAALNMSATDAQKLASEPRKSTIGQRKPASKVDISGASLKVLPKLGAKKAGGLGAQRVKKDFSAIEKEAARNDQLRQEAKQLSKEEQQQSLQSLERAYEDMSLAGKREEERMKRTDPMKAQQAERLGY